MKRALIVFGSRTGDTEEMAEWIAGRFDRKGYDVTTEDCTDVLAEGLFVPYDVVVLGSPSYDDRPQDVQEDFQNDILNQLQHTGISGKKVAVFGGGDSKYPRFCGAVDAIEEQVQASGGQLIVPSLKVDSPYLSYRDEVEAWADRVADAV